MVLAVLALAYVVARSVLVPFVHDEARTFFLYTQSGLFLPPEAKPDAANHLLVTSVAWPMYRLFGMAPWVLRAFGVVCFALYAVHAFRMGAMVRSKLVRWCLWAALLGTPVFLEFFGLYRGYGPGLALLLASLYHMIRFSEKGTAGQLAMAAGSIALAVSASLTLLVPACVVMALLLWGLRAERGRALIERMVIWCLLGVVPLVHLASHALDLAERGELYHGTPSGLVSVTLPSLGFLLFGVDGPWIRGAFKLAVAVALVAAFLSLLRDGWRRPGAAGLLLVVFGGELIGRWVLHEWSGVLYPLDRGALHLALMVVVLYALALDRWAPRRPWIPYAALVLLALPLRLFTVMNFDRTIMWPGQGVHETLLRAVWSAQAEADRPLALAAHVFLKDCIAYEAQWRQWGVPSVQVNAPRDHADLLWGAMDTMPADPGYRLLASHSGMGVFERIEPLSLTLVAEKVFIQHERTHAAAWQLPTELLEGGPVLVEMEAVIWTEASPLKVEWVMEQTDGSGRHLLYDATPLGQLRSRWSGDTLWLVRWVPWPTPPAAVTSIHFRDHMDMGIRLDPCHIRIWKPLNAGTTEE